MFWTVGLEPASSARAPHNDVRCEKRDQKQILVKNHFLEFIIIILFIRKKIYQRTFAENLKGIGPLGRELCKLFRGQVRRKIIKTLKETSTWTRHACVQQQKFCPSVADSVNGWQPVQTGSDEEYVHHNIMPEVVFEVTKPTYISLMKKALLQRCLKGVTQSQNELSKTL